MKVLFDTNVILDALTERYLDSHYSKDLISFLLQEKIKGYLLTSQINDIYYCLRKYCPSEEKKRGLIKVLCDSFVLISPVKSDLLNACNSKITDFEDSLIDEIARVYKIDYIVTNNVKDFCNSCLPVLSPKEMVDIVVLASSKTQKTNK